MASAPAATIDVTEMGVDETAGLAHDPSFDGVGDRAASDRTLSVPRRCAHSSRVHAKRFRFGGVAIDVIENFTNGDPVVATLARRHSIRALVPDQRTAHSGLWRRAEKSQESSDRQPKTAFIAGRGNSPKPVAGPIGRFLDHRVSFDGLCGVDNAKSRLVIGSHPARPVDGLGRRRRDQVRGLRENDGNVEIAGPRFAALGQPPRPSGSTFRVR